MRDQEQREEVALRRFIDAVLALADDPSPENLESYLAASRALDGSRHAPRRARGRTRHLGDMREAA